jgi:hypothetical protein
MDAREERTFNRRELLKAITAAGGAIVASTLLPGEWAKPVVEVGVLPAHAQVSDLEPQYGVQCDSTPGGGDITVVSEFCIDEVAALVVLYSGEGQVEGIDVTLTCSDPTIEFTPALPQVVTTDAEGRALFGTLCILSEEPDGTEFDLVFTYPHPVTEEPVAAGCGTYRIVHT